jgi:diacylglycerol O-acyltransferase / wax synthase
MSESVTERTATVVAAPRHPARLLLVTGALGAGHHAAARAVEERARLLWPGVEVTWTDTLDGMGAGTATAFRAIYAGCVRHLPWLYALYFWALGHVPPFRAAVRRVIGTWSAPGLARAVARHRPDLVVATFPEGVTGLGRLRRRGRLPVPTVALVADPAPHPLWVDPGLDLHLVSTAAGAELLGRIAPDAPVRVAALPVARAFAPAAPPAGAPVLVSCGSLGFGAVADACAAVLDTGADVLVSTSRNPGLRQRLDRLAATHPRGGALRVVDWIDDPAAATRGCAAVVTNAGGATALEALACGRPLLLFDPIPGHGRANARVLVAAGLATSCPTPAALAAAVTGLARPDLRSAAARRAVAARDLATDVAVLAGLAAPAGGARIRAQDALFVHVDTAATPQQVGACVRIADSDRADWPAILTALIGERAAGIELLCRRLAAPRPGRPVHWIRDPVVDPARHLRPGVVTIGSDAVPTADAALTAFFAEPLDPRTTAWELRIGRDAAAGQTVLMAKVHHALGDGLAVTDALARLLTDVPSPLGPTGPRRARTGSRVRTAARQTAVIVRGVASLALAGTAGPSPLTGAGGRGPASRITAELDGATVRAAARAHGVGTTALLLAVLADALHAGFTARDPAGVPASVRVMVPMTTRTAAGVDTRAPGNRTAAVSLALPTGPMAPHARATAVAAGLRAGSGAGQPAATAAVLTTLGLLPGWAQAPLIRLVYGRRFFHAIASVMPGSRRTLRVRGRAITAVHPVLPLADGVGLAVGALHWRDRTEIGITADPVLVPDAAALPGRLAASLERMRRG